MNGRRLIRGGIVALMLNILLFICLLIICGCSAAGESTTPEFKADLPAAKEIQRAVTWTWDTGLYYVPEDHQSIERLPIRAGDYHVNVNKFIEPPKCAYCLQIAKPIINPDGTWEVSVTLRHPFPNSPEYTGFDVRGTIMFPATRYWEKEPPFIVNEDGVQVFQDFVPLYFSRAEDGGGQLLNADGFSLYFFPGLLIPGFNLPIFKYSKGNFASGPDPDSTVNGYKLFTNDTERRMFLVTDEITRTYHIDPPDGAFTFGYVVDASWSQPTTTPVTDPAEDFPFWANCEDGYVLEFEQINPFKTGTYYSPPYPPSPPPLTERHVTRAAIKIYHVDPDVSTPGQFEVTLMCPDLTSDPILKNRGVAFASKPVTLDAEARIYESYPGIFQGTYDAEPGEYLALLLVNPNIWAGGWDKDNNYWPIQFKTPAFFDFITLEVIAGD